MLTIIICDDEVKFRQQLREKLSVIAAEEMSIHECGSAAELRELLEGNQISPDAIFMDIQLGDENGIETAAQIQRNYPWVALVFITGYLEFATDIFLAKPTYFLVKPFDDVKLADALRCVGEFRRNCMSRPIRLKSKSGVVQINRSEIYYVESNRRRLNIVMPSETYSVYMKMSDLAEQLADDFLDCHKSYTVNMNYIEYFNSEKIIMKNGHEIPISRSKYKKAKEKFLNFSFADVL